MSQRNNRFFLEFNQSQELNKIFYYEIKDPDYLSEKRFNQGKSNLYDYYDYFNLINDIFTLKPICEETEPEVHDNKHCIFDRKDSVSHKEKDFLGRKKKMSPKPKHNDKTNLFLVKFASGNSSAKKLDKTKICENVNTRLNIFKKKKEEELNITFTQGMSNKSTESTELKISQLSKESEQIMIQEEMKTKFISLLGEAHERPENKNIEEEVLIENLKNFLDGYILKKSNQNESEKTGINALDYFNLLISKKNPQIQQEDKDKKLEGLYYLINIFKNKNNKKKQKRKKRSNNNNNYCGSSEDIERKNREGNLVNIIKNWIRNSFKEDFKEVSELYELEKKENIQPIEKDNNNKELDLKFFKSNFEIFFMEHERILKKDEKQRAQKKKIFDYLIKIKKEKNPEKYLINMTKLDYLNKIKDEKFSKFLERDQKAQEISYKTEKCRIKYYELYKSKNLEGLLVLSDQFYKDKVKYIKICNLEAFENKIREIEGYEDFKLELSKRENKDIQARAEIFKKIVSDPVGFLTND